MKKQLTIIALFIAAISFAQYSKSSLKPSFGITKIQDVTSFEMFNTQLEYRHMLNTKFGASLRGGYTRLYDTWEYIPNQEPISFNTAALHGVVNIGRLLEFESFTRNYTILGSLGGTYTYSEGSTNNQIYHRYSNFHLSATIDNEVKITKGIFANASLDFIKDVNNRPFVPSTETTNIFNINLGVTISLNHSKEHADWYIEEKIPVVDTVFMKPTIIDKTVTKREIVKVKSNEIEYVFFNNNSHTVDKDGLNAIVKASDKIAGSQTITVIGYASPPASDDYNLKLSKHRAEAVVDKLISIGIMESQINLLYRGEIDTKNGKNIDLSRRVALIVE